MPAMNQQMLDVMQRRAELLARINSQRERMSEIAADLQAPLKLADRGLAAVRFLRAHPVSVVAVAALFVIRRRGVVALAMGAWRVWKGYRSITSLAGKAASRL